MPAETAEEPTGLARRGAVLLSLLVVAVAATRLPFLGAAYGRDPDASRVVVTARELLATGDYEPSRLPGYPVQEYFTALLVWGGPWVVNGMACVMSCVAAAAFAVWLRRLGLKHYLPLAVGFACVPVIYVNSTSGMDYVWALAFVMCSVVFATDGKPWASGICAGLAIGTRITSGAMLLPLALLIAATSPSWRQTAKVVSRLWLAALGVGALCFVPIFVKFGSGFLPDAHPVGGRVGVAVALERATIDLWGVLGLVALGWAAAAAGVTRGRTGDRLPKRERYWVSAACVSAILLYAIAYMRLPLESGYLVPLVPFTIALAALWLTDWSNLVFAALLCASPFFGSMRAGFQLAGPIFDDHEAREAQTRAVERIIGSARELPAGSLVLAGSRLPAIQAALPNDSPERERFTSLIWSEAQYQQLKRERRTLYFIDRSTESYQQKVNGIRLRTIGAHLLPGSR